MKTPVAITLILIGGLLVAAPIFSDYFERQQLAAAISKPNVNEVRLGPTLSTEYRFGCWFLGGVMVFSAVILSTFAGKRTGQVT